MLLADPSSPMNWNESAMNLALIGAAWPRGRLAGAAEALVGGYGEPEAKFQLLTNSGT